MPDRDAPERIPSEKSRSDQTGTNRSNPALRPPDFTRLVRDHLALPPLARRDADSVIEEIAAQMEDAWREALAVGATGEQALADALELIDDWEALASEIVGSVGSDRAERTDRWLEEHEEASRRRGRIGIWLADLGRDVRLASRSLLRRPGFALMAGLSLTIGLGAATTLFSITNGILFTPLPISDPDSVVAIYQGDFGTHNYANFLALQAECADFVDLAACDEFWFAGKGVQPLFVNTGAGVRRVSLGLVSGEYFPVLDVGAARGRLIGPEDNRIGAGEPVAVLSWDCWQDLFAGDPGIVGSPIEVGRTTLTIVGVAAEGFTGSGYVESIDLWVPATIRPAFEPPEEIHDLIADRMHWFHLVGRLRSDIGFEQARARLAAVITGSQSISEGLQEDGATLLPIRVSAIPPLLRERTVGYLRILLVAVGLVVLVVCVNLSSLFMTRIDEQAHEIATRRALGAGTGTLLRHYLTECALLALLGGAGAVLLSLWLTGVLFHMLSGVLRLSETAATVTPDLRVLGFALLLAGLSALAMGFLPIVRTRRYDLTASLRPGSGVTRSPARLLAPQNLLVTGQIAIALILLIGAGLLVRSIARLQNQEFGFNTENILTVSLENELLPLDAASGGAQYERVLTRVRAVPGIEAAAIARVVPLSGETWGGIMQFEGYEAGPDEYTRAAENYIDPGFFDLMGIPLIAGRSFTADDRSGSEPVVIVNASLAGRYWPDSDPLGKTVAWRSGEVFTVVGVVADHFYASLRRGSEHITYYPITQTFVKSPALLIRTTADPLSRLPAVREAINGVEPQLTLWKAASLRSMVRDRVSRDRTMMTLLLTFAVIATLVALLGTYGVVSTMVTRRRQEIGIRIALGARQKEVVRHIIGRGMRVIAVGVLAGFTLAALAVQTLRHLLFGVGPIDAATFLAVGLLIAAAGLLACVVPARRAIAVDPIQTLRND